MQKYSPRHPLVNFPQHFLFSNTHILRIFVTMSNNLTQPLISRRPSGHSTNSLLAAEVSTLPHGAVISLVEQTAGRGQRGNSWEAEPGKNITMSMLLRPQHIEPRQQFMISEFVSLAIVRFLRAMLAGTPYADQVAVKWPNDIYVGDRKICGILIEHTLGSSGIIHTIVGIGLNINQLQFLSPAPNPVSLAQLTGRQYDVEEAERSLCTLLLSMADEYDNPATFSRLHHQYMDSLWRRSGMHPYIDAATGQRFDASIADVLPTGHLILRRADTTLSTYAFKEATALL